MSDIVKKYDYSEFSSLYNYNARIGSEYIKLSTTAVVDLASGISENKASIELVKEIGKNIGRIHAKFHYLLEVKTLYANAINTKEKLTPNEFVINIDEQNKYVLKFFGQIVEEKDVYKSLGKVCNSSNVFLILTDTSHLQFNFNTGAQNYYASSLELILNQNFLNYLALVWCEGWEDYRFKACLTTFANNDILDLWGS